MEECNTGITITQTVEECLGNYVSSNCVATPNAITYLDLSAGASQTQINANIVSALMRKDEQISEIPIANGSETKIVAGTNVTVTGTGTNLSNYVISATGVSSGTNIPVSSTLSGIVNNNSLQELGGADKLINGIRIGRGGFNDPTNTAIGVNTLTNNISYVNTAVSVNALASNTTGGQNTAVGFDSIFSNISGGSNTAIGVASLRENTTGSNNTAIGQNTLKNNTTGSNNTAIGQSAGTSINSGSNNILTTNSVFIGVSTKALVSGGINEIVVGHNAVGAGTNTVTLGNTLIEKTILRGTINVGNLLVFADNSAAISGGLIVGDMYRTSIGDLKVRF